MDERPIIQERQGEVSVITLNRPEARNAIDGHLARGLGEAFDRLDQDAGLKVGVVSGAPPGFCAGMDLKSFGAGEDVWEGVDGMGVRRIVTEAARKPLIAAIEGFALGGGLEIALACDLIVTGRGAKLGLPEVSRSLVPAGGALRHLPRRVGSGGTMRLALTGDPVDGVEAVAMGLADVVVDDGSALSWALATATRIAAHDSSAVLATKEIIKRQFGWPAAAFWDRQAVIAVAVNEQAKASHRTEKDSDLKRSDVVAD